MSVKRIGIGLSAIAAICSDNGLGNKGGLPWRNHFKVDMLRFRDLTWGKMVIMGRKTFESLPDKKDPLPGRQLLVITHMEEKEFKRLYKDKALGVLVVKDREDALRWANTFGYHQTVVIGGLQIYQMFWKDISYFYLTKIHKMYDADVHFPLMPDSEWSKEYETHLESGVPQTYMLLRHIETFVES